MTDDVEGGGLPERTLTPSDAVAARLKELRRQRGWSAAKLAEHCTQAGAPHLTTSVLANIETGRPDTHGVRRRDITIDELLVLAYVLNVAPLHLLGLPDDHTHPTAVLVAPGHPVTDPDLLQRWLRGDQPLPGTAPSPYRAAALEHTPTPNADDAAEPTHTALQNRAKDIVTRFHAETDRLAAHTRNQLTQLITDAEHSLTNGATTDDILTLLRTARHNPPEAHPDPEA